MKNRLAQLRNEQGIWQETLAQKLNVSQQKLSRYEQGIVKNIDPDLEDAICEFFDCSLDYLRCKSNVRNDAKQYQTLKKVADLIENFYSDVSGEQIKKDQDLSDEQLVLFENWILSFKDLFSKYSKLSSNVNFGGATGSTTASTIIENGSDEH